MNKQKLIDASNSKGLCNSIISIYYDIGRIVPFKVQRFPDGRISDWYCSQYWEVVTVKPGGKGGMYGKAFGFLYRNGEKATEGDTPEQISCAACGSWVLLDIMANEEDIQEEKTVTIYGLNDVLKYGKHKGEKVADVVKNDWNWIVWASDKSKSFYFDTEALLKEHEKYIKILGLDDIITFGKYKGKTIGEVSKTDRQYLIWLSQNNDSFNLDWEKIK